MKIELFSPEVRIKAIKTKTKAKVFEQFEEGDVLQFSMILRNTTNWGRGNYATHIVTHNRTKGLTVVKSQSNLLNVLQAFELEEVPE
jgi:hypothetical protein